MSWMEELSRVYQHNQSLVGTFEDRRKQRITLLPVSHVMQSAQIEVLVTRDGEFYSAKVIEKENARTIVPATPGSANRSNAPAPHYLHDKLQYVSGDYVQYGGDPKQAGHYQLFLEQLKDWANSAFFHPKVNSIYKYIAYGSLIEDLVKHQILPVDAHGQLIEKWPKDSDTEKPAVYRVVSGDVTSAFVRFGVVHETAEDPVVWEDKTLFDAFIRFLKEQIDMPAGVCYVTGNQEKLTSQHGSRIRNAGDMSKLISANDEQGFTYRGRFALPSEAVQIGYETSQKAHHALRWLIQRQGTYVDSRYFIAFGIEQPEVPGPFDSTEELAGGSAVLNQLLQKEQETATEIAHTEELVANELNRALHGMHFQLEKSGLKNVTVMAVDAATTGRLAIVYYQSIHAAQFFSSIKQWHQTCRWLQLVKDQDTSQLRRFVGTPSTYRIAEAVYGTKADSRIKKELYTRLLPCIVEQKPIPKDIITIIFNRVRNPSSFANSMESWDGTLNVACALIRKRYEKEGYTVAVQEENNSRDYLFGRMLGIAEVMERGILKEREEKRATNATRYFNAFSQHPARTWMVIRKQLIPYFERLGTGATRYAKSIQQLEDRLTIENMTNDPLEPVFLLGYSSQIQEMYRKKGDNEHDSITK